MKAPDPRHLTRHDPEPSTGSVVVVDLHGPRPEVWYSDLSNIGNWYTIGWTTLTDSRGRKFDTIHHPNWYDVCDRGPVTLLVPADADAYLAGWRAGRKDLLWRIEEIAEDDPTPEVPVHA